jgi:hypothetical protein
VRVGRIPEVMAPLRALGRFMDRGPRGKQDEPLWTDDASAEARVGFFAAAAHFERSAPWSVAGDGQILRLDAPALGWVGACASVLGAAAEEYGLLLLRSVDDYVAFARRADRVLSGGSGSRRIGIPLLSVKFDHPHDVVGGKVLAREARAHGWKPGPEGRLPYLLKASPDNAALPLTSEDYRVATVFLEAVRAFVEKHRRLFDGPPKKNVGLRIEVPTPEGDVEATVTAPPADLPWAWGEEEPVEGLRRLDAVTLREGFREARRAAGASEDEAAEACQCVDEALRFKTARGERGDRWTADDVEAYLLDHYPARGGAPDEDLERVPVHLDAFLEWLAASGPGNVLSLRAARACLARCRERFLRDARDPRRFGPAKTLVRAMLAEGIDPTDRRAADRFIEVFNERVQEDPSLLPLPGEHAPHGKAWVWTPDQPPPDPRGPCPCGSGKRYRKCCMPR